MTTAIESMFGAIDQHLASVESNQALSSDYISAMKDTAAAVEKWCADNHLTQESEVGTIKFEAAAESFVIDELPKTIGPEKLKDLCTAAKVSAEHLNAACKRVAALLNATLGRKPGVAFNQFRAKANSNQTLLATEELVPASILAQTQKTESLEGFGINVDRVEPDLKTILTIALLQFHTNLVPRIMPIQTVTQGNITIVREALEVFDLADKKMIPTRVLELYRDPSMVSTRAQRIVPLKANDTEGKFLLADDIYLFKKTINLFEMSLVEGKDGWDKFNHTDLIEDGIQLDGILLKITKKSGSGETATTKDFYKMLPIPYGRGRLTQVTNDLASTDRRLSLDRYPAAVLASDAAYTKVASLVSDAAAIADFTGGLRLQLDVKAYVHVDRRTALADAISYVDISVVGANDTVKTDEQRKAVLDAMSVDVIGYTLDARYNEDNKRKTSIRAELRRRSMSYELPAGRNFVIDAAIGQDGVINAAAHLAQLEHIGRDYNALKIITETMNAVHDQNISMNNDKLVQASLAAQYAAGDLVNPYVYRDTLDMSGMYGVRSADASGDVKQFLKTYFCRLTSELNLKTFFKEQLAAGAPVVYRVITSPTILGDLFMAKHIHEHLESSEKGTGGVESVLVLDNAVRLEIVTCTFDDMKDKIILIPYLANSQNSVLNFASDYDQGTLVGSISVASDGGPAYTRMFACTRELPVPTNVMGAIVNVIGYTGVTMTDTSSSLTVMGVAEG